MKVLYHSILLFVFLSLLCTRVEAQYAWTISLDQKDDSTTNYGPLQLSCNGNHCTAFVTASGKTGVWYKFLRSDDGGLSWREQKRFFDNGTSVYFVYALQQIDSLNVVAVGDSGHVFRTFDGGVTWELQSCPEPYSITSAWGVHFHDPMNGIAGLPDRPMITSDGGRHWVLGPYTGVGSGCCHCYGPGKFAVLRETTGQIHRTADNWATMDSTPALSDTGFRFPDFSHCDWGEGDTIIAYGFESGLQQGLAVRTTDGGITWKKSPVGKGAAVGSISTLSDDTLLAGRGDFGRNTVLFSSDQGQSWASDSIVISSSDKSFGFDVVNAIARPASGVVLAVVQAIPIRYASGLILRGTIASAGVPSNNIIATASAYPNPATEKTAISFKNRDGLVHVLDILGREVVRYTIPLDGLLKIDVSELPAGIYYVINGQERSRFVKE